MLAVNYKSILFDQSALYNYYQSYLTWSYFEDVNSQLKRALLKILKLVHT